MEEQSYVMKPNSHMALAVLTTICCCLPLGIVAIIKANSVNSLYMAKQYEAANLASQEAQKWSIIGIVCSLVIWLIYIVFFWRVSCVRWINGNGKVIEKTISCFIDSYCGGNRFIQFQSHKLLAYAKMSIQTHYRTQLSWMWYSKSNLCSIAWSYC